MRQRDKAGTLRDLPLISSQDDTLEQLLLVTPMLPAMLIQLFQHLGIQLLIPTQVLQIIHIRRHSMRLCKRHDIGRMHNDDHRGSVMVRLCDHASVRDERARLVD